MYEETNINEKDHTKRTKLLLPIKTKSGFLINEVLSS